MCGHEKYLQKAKEFCLKENKEKLKIEISDFEHGFMNKKSKNFDKKVFGKYKAYLKAKLRSLAF
ncbi:hypothetical protein [Halarcobacter bivalviorum]|uniref:Dienelactone hydrolase domain-containing protein n=1 Tax=Halarcobacter bivalviorum TaxID=663364 RepID=A0AAX2A8W6_9BACT|nr:hypothetical protein [Halarcobacter bivalviorum]RXK10518.1 hypothetical protein CRV05_04370 [Halarcobacter bivalviorum]